MKHRELTVAAGLVALLVGCADYSTISDETPDPVTVSVSAVSDTTVTLTWTRSDATDFRCYKVYYGSSDVVDSTDHLADTLTFNTDLTKTVSGLDPDTRYYFRVIVVTQAGFISASNTVSATTLPDARFIQLFVPDSLTDTSVYLQWTRSRDPAFNYYLLFLDTTANVDTNATPMLSIRINNVNDTTRYVDQLLRGKKYWIRLHVKSSRAFIASSAVVTITTPTGRPAPVTLQVVDDRTTDTSAMLLWSRNRDATFAQYIVYFDTVHGVDSAQILDTSAANVVGITSSTDTMLTVTWLKRATKYWFAVYVQGRNGLTSVSNVDTTTTATGLPKAVTLSVQDARTTDTSAALVWTKNKDADFGQYIVCFDTIDDVDSGQLLDTSALYTVGIPVASDTTLTIDWLKRGKKYWFAVYVQDQSGLTAVSNTDTTTTQLGIPAPVQLIITRMQDSAVSLRWSKNKDADFLHYLVFADTNVVFDTLSAPMRTLDTQIDTVCTLNGIADTVRYWFSVYVQDRSGFKAGSNRVVNHPVILKAGTVTDSSVALRWARSVSPSFAAYKVYRDTVAGVTENSRCLTTQPITVKFTTDYTDVAADSGKTYFYRVFHYESDSLGDRVGSSNELRVVAQ